MKAVVSTKPKSTFRTSFSENIFNRKYRHEGAKTWKELSNTLANDVCGDLIPQDVIDEIARIHAEMKIIAGGRYLYYAGRDSKFFNSCFLFRALEDSREDWANLSWKSESALMTGGGIGIDYSIYRGKGNPLSKTGGVASGPISKMRMINEIGREVMQGGSRRSAMYGSLNWKHVDIWDFMHAKDWNNMPVAGTGGMTVGQLKEADFNFPAPLDMTNISVNYDNDFLKEVYPFLNDLPLEEMTHYSDLDENIRNLPIDTIPKVFRRNCYQLLKTGEPGLSFNFFNKENETLRNACCELVSEDDSDVCNLGSLNMGAFDNLDDFREAVRLLTMFLLCGTLKAHLPFKKVEKVREKNRRLGLGLIGIHEWLMKRGYKYEVVPELHDWLEVYRNESTKTAYELADKLGITRPVGIRAIAPTGTISIMASSTSGIEPLLAVSYKRRFLSGNKDWHYEYVVDGTATVLINEYGLKPDDIETALDLANDYERRIKFQADVQHYVDQAISSTINLPSWNSEENNEDGVDEFAKTVIKYAHRLRGLTCYPDGSRGGQPLTPVPYHIGKDLQGREFKEEFSDICDLTGGGTCGM